MNHCTGLMGRVCSCGMWHGDGGRAVDTHRDEAPQARPRTFVPDFGIEGPQDDFARSEGVIVAFLRWRNGFLVIAAGCAVMAVISYFVKGSP